MMDVLVPAARERGYAPDAVVCASEVPAGRPFSRMRLLNAIRLQVHTVEAMVKVGDVHPADIERLVGAVAASIAWQA